LCSFNIGLLGIFIAATQQDNDLVSALLEIDTISWTVMNAQFADALSYRLHIAWQTIGQTKEAGSNQRFALRVTELAFPLAVGIGLFDV
jgi:hypothetical protein